MEMNRIPLKSGDEYDAFTRWRNIHFWKRGELKKIKRKFTKRVRRYNKKVCLEELAEMDE